MSFLEKPCSGAKTLGWEHSKIGDWENVFENLGVVLYSTEMFSEKRFGQMKLEWITRSWWFYEKVIGGSL
jgi:hypothetical protein